MMQTVVLWLFSGASLALFSQTYLADGAPLQVMAAPNLLRVGTPENVFVECQDCSGGPQNVEIIVITHPTKIHRLAATNVTIDSGNNFQAMGQITIPASEFNKDPNLKQYVVLQAQFPGRLLEKLVMVSFQSGHIFIQTDKTIYKPGSKVNYRMFAVNPSMEPVSSNWRETDTSLTGQITVDVVNPDGIVVDFRRFRTRSGISESNYNLPGIDSSSSVGVWKFVARFEGIPQQSYSAEFEVKEYVLPSFEVKLFPERSCFYVDNDQLHVDIKATYLFGTEVQGTAHVVFGVIDQHNQKKSFPSSLQRVQVVGGLGRATLERRTIMHVFPDISELMKSKSHIYVSASVLTESGSEMVMAEVRDIHIVMSPYTIHLKKTPKYFKPGMPFKVVITVMNCDDTPAAGVAVVVDPGHVLAVTDNNGIAKVHINPMVRGASHLYITAKTVDKSIRDNRQASVSMRAIAYTSITYNYLHITADTDVDSRLGSTIRISIYFLGAPQNLDITYLILSRGQLVKAGRYRRQGQPVLMSLPLLITKDMLPSFRVVVYYHTGTSEVVSDSTWVEVKNTCMGSLTLESAYPEPYTRPNRRFGLKVTGDPGATVGLVAVDKAVYVLNNKHRLTQKKVWDIVDKHDTGCTPGGGEDSMGVFYDAGLLFETSTASGTPYRQELKCAVSTRRKRSLTIIDVKTTLGRRYSDETQRQCCVDGMKDTSVSQDCQRGSHYMGEDQACVEAFVQCCTELASQQSDMKKEPLYPARRKRSDEDYDEDYLDSQEIILRSHQPESWLWSLVTLPNCPPNDANCKLTSTSMRDHALPHSMTTWQVTGISLSKTHGLCVADPLEVMVRKPFFMDLRLPYVAVQGEQLQVKAVLHNISPDLVTVRVDLIESSAAVCSLASKRRMYRLKVDVEPYSTRSLPFVIRPLNAGLHPVEVKASVKGSFSGDGIGENLQVLPEGDLMKESKHVKLEPAKHGGEHVLSLVSSVIPEKDPIPGTPVTTMILLTVQRPFKEPVVSGSSMGGLIRQASSTDGEHNMMSMALTASAAAYLDETNAWEDVGFDKREEALRHIRTGYTNQLAFRRTAGCFAMSQRHVCSTWLTAFVVKVLAMSSKLVVDMHARLPLICDSVRWLILHTQVKGSFVETGRVNNREMAGDVFGVDSDASITAFTLIAMQQARHMCAAITNSMPDSIDGAVGYLERRLPSLTNPYAVAITSYALAIENKLNKEILYKFASTDASHWPVSSDVYTLETTAYSLLALVTVKAFDDAEPVVRWLNKQRRSFDGGYGSTQATMLVYQSLSEYWTTESEYDLDVDVSVPDRQPNRFNFNNDNFYDSRTFLIRGINQKLQVTARGSGEATLTMTSFYFKEKRNELSAQFSECGRPQYGIPEPGDVERIIGGKTSVPGTHPWQASLQRRPTGSPEPFKHVCGGTLIASCWVLTAAHCMNDSMDMRVVLGGVDVIRDEEYDQFIPVERAFVHEDYRVSYSKGRASALHNDIALLQLRVMDSPFCVKESRYVKTACLPKQRFPDGMVSCVISGWGITVPVMATHQVPPWYRPSKLLDAQVPLLPQQSCMAPHVYGARLDNTMICAGYLTGEVDACQGDSGGPLVCEQTGTHYITGVVSFGDGCAQRDKPGVYANVHRYVDWITETISNPNARNRDSELIDYIY